MFNGYTLLAQNMGTIVNNKYCCLRNILSHGAILLKIILNTLIYFISAIF